MSVALLGRVLFHDDGEFSEATTAQNKFDMSKRADKNAKSVTFCSSDSCWKTCKAL